MENLILYDPSNAIKALAVESAHQNYGSKFLLRKISPATINDIRPIKKSEVEDGAKRQAEELHSAFPKSELQYYKNIYAVGIQKGVTVLDEGQISLISIIHTLCLKSGNPIISECSTIPLPNQLRGLVMNQGIEIYKCWAILFGEEVGEKLKTKEISLYEYLTRKKEYQWILDGVQNNFNYLNNFV